MGNPVNLVDLYFSERPSFHSQDFFEELRLGVQAVLIVVASQDLERFQNILDIEVGDWGLFSNLFNRKSAEIWVKQQV